MSTPIVLQLLLTRLTLVGLACGKRRFVPEQAPSTAAGHRLVVESIPTVDASAWSTFEPPAYKNDDAPAAAPSPLATTCQGVSLLHLLAHSRSERRHRGRRAAQPIVAPRAADAPGRRLGLGPPEPDCHHRALTGQGRAAGRLRQHEPPRRARLSS